MTMRRRVTLFAWLAAALPLGGCGWLPDAYTEAPAPVAAMLAGVLETVAVYAILRSRGIVDQAVSPAFTGSLLALFGLVSFAIAASLCSCSTITSGSWPIPASSMSASWRSGSASESRRASSARSCI